MPMKTKSALSWFGSDSEVAANLAAMLDHCSHVTIPFVGGAAIIPHLKSRAILANDLHDAAINFYRVIGGVYGAWQREELIRRCNATLSHPSELDAAMEVREQARCKEHDLAWAFWAQCWLGRKGKGGCKGEVKLPSVRYTANGGTNASRIKSAAADLEAWVEHFKRCEWTCEDFREFIPKLRDDPKNGVYCDYGWVGAGGEYLHAATAEGHRDLAGLLKRFKESTVVVRYDDCETTRSLYSDYEAIEASSRTQSNGQIKEVWFVKNRPSQ